MKRVLDFAGPKGNRRFELLLTALMAGGDGKPEGRTPAAIRKEARLIEAFEFISDPLPAALSGADPSARVLHSTTNGDGPPTLTLTQEDFDLLQQVHREDPVDAAHGPRRRGPVGLPVGL